MQLVEPDGYIIRFTPEAIIRVNGPNGERTFVHPVTQRGQKLYVVSEGTNPIYVGATNQPIKDRLRQGFQANVVNGYRGYLWRHFLREATIDIWTLEVENQDIEEMNGGPSIVLADGDRDRKEKIVVEALEAEVVLLIREQIGHWPMYQSEIHFHQPGAGVHAAARQVFNHYGVGNAQPPNHRNQPLPAAARP